MLAKKQSKSDTYSPALTLLNQKNYQSILTTLFIVLLPHFFYMPIALTILMILVLVLWQGLLLKQGHFRQAQNKWLQYFVVLLGLGLIYLQYRTFFGIEAGCATLALILLGKAFEVKNYRDAIIQFNFGLFVLASVFLYGQGILLAIAVLIGVFSCFYGMYQLQSYHNAYEEVLIQDVSTKQLRQQAVKTVLKLLLVAAPLMVVLFLFVPRIPPLWSIPAPNQQAKTGISDEMSPGDIAKLSQSSALAFRVVFEQPEKMPQKSQLYWRAMVLEDFNGIKWTQNYRTKYASFTQTDGNSLDLPDWYQPPAHRNQFATIDYRMIIEPTFQRWVYALDYSVAKAPLQLKPDFSVQLTFDLTQRRQFNLQLLNPNPLADVTLSDLVMQRNLYLPSSANPKAKAFAQQLFIQSGQQPERYAQAVLNWIRHERFSYTLSPPLLNNERIDDFLFRTRAGFCEHYASAYVNLMRMVGIPARVVVGYQGGKAAPDGQTWEVRQLDAHAWTEIWLQGKGWQRIDPTAAIAPERVEQGMQDYASDNQTLYDGTGLSHWQRQWLTEARVWSDYMNYQWQNKVVGFDRDKQYQWLKKLSIDNLSKQLIFLILAVASSIGLVVWWLSRGQKVTLSQLDLALQRLSQRLHKVGLQRLPNEPILTWLKRIEAEHCMAEDLYSIEQLYTRHIYIQSLSDIELKRLLYMIGKYTIKSTE